mgnify:CR=1 FL=1
MTKNNGINDFLNSLPAAKRQDILEQFRESFDDHRQKCISAFNSKDFKALRAGAHDLKTLSRLIGSKDLGDMCEKIEIGALNEDPDLYALQENFSRTSADVDSELHKFRLAE